MRSLSPLFSGVDESLRTSETLCQRVHESVRAIDAQVAHSRALLRESHEALKHAPLTIALAPAADAIAHHG